jgi:TonB family protein
VHALFGAALVGGGAVLVGDDDARAKRRQEEIARLAEKAQFAHIVEAPDYAETGVPDVPTDIASDRSVRGATPDGSEKGESPLPQVHGEMPTFELSPSGERTELPRTHALKAPGDGEGDEGEGRDGTPQDPTGVGPPRKVLPAGGLEGGRSGSDAGAEGALSGGIGAGLPSLPLPSALGLGGVSFNTLEWDFAPYAIELKRRIADHWYPPIAFTYGGLYGGVTVLRFRIGPDGTLTGPELISGAEHSSLDTAAINAVKLAAPYRPLPDNFPEPNLEVTFSFHYLLGPRARVAEPGAQ